MNQIKLSTAIQDFIVKWQPLSIGRPDLEDLVGAMKALYTASKYYEENGVSPVEYSDALTLLGKMTAECRNLRELQSKAPRIPDGWDLVPKWIHPLESSTGGAVIQLLATPPDPGRIDNPEDYYQFYWEKLLAASKGNGDVKH